MPRVTVNATITRTLTIPDDYSADALAANFAGMLDQHADRLEADGWWAPRVEVEPNVDESERGWSFTTRPAPSATDPD